MLASHIYDLKRNCFCYCYCYYCYVTLFLMTLLHLKSTGLILEQIIKCDDANILFTFVRAGLAILCLGTLIYLLLHQKTLLI